MEPASQSVAPGGARLLGWLPFPTVWMWVWLGLVAVTHVYRIPRDDNYSFREAQTAMITENLLADDFDVLHPRVNYFGPEYPHLALEFPLYNAVVAAAYLVTGVEPAVGRWLSVLCSLLSCPYVYRIARRAAGEEIARWATVVYLMVPAMQVYGQSHRPDTMMYLFLFGAIEHTLAALERGRMVSWIVATLFWVGAILLKMTPLLVFAVFSLGAGWKYRLWQRPGWGAGLRLVGLGTILGALVLAWARHAGHVNANAPFYGTPEFTEFNFGTWRERLDWRSYLMGLRDAVKLLSLPWLLLALTGLVQARRAARDDFPLGGLLVSGVLSYLIFWHTSLVNPHYMMIFALPLAYYAAHGVVHLIQWCRAVTPRWSRPLAVGCAAGALLVNIATHWFVVDYFVRRPSHQGILAAADYARSHLPAVDYIAFVSGQHEWAPTEPGFFFYAKRTGINLPDVAALAAERDRLVAQGYCWALIGFGPSDSFRLPSAAAVEAELRQHHLAPYAQGRQYVVTRLN